MSTDSPSEHELPDDVNRWPSDPAALLGVAEGVTRRDLKRAYTRLIKRFKPEHSPEQFRRLREAFEQLDQQLEWREEFESHLAQQRYQTGDGNDDDSDGAARSESSTGVESELKNTTPHSKPLSVPPGDDLAGDGPMRTTASSNETDQLWQQALNGGDLKAVYSQLVEFAVRRPPSEIGFARLYWLLTIHPEFESRRDPVAWLIEGMHKHGFNNRLLSMFSIEVRRRMGQVPLALADDLFDGNEAANRLVDLVQPRWFAARCLNRFDIIGADVERLRTRFLDEPDEWQRLLCGAVRQLVMVRSERAESLLTAVREELASTFADVSSNWLWDSLESIVALHEAWADSSKRLLTKVDIPANDHMQLSRLVTLVEVTWECSPHQARLELMTMCVALTADLQTSLHELAWITRVSRPLVRRLLELLHEQRSEFNGDDDYEITPVVEDELRRFVRDELWQKRYSTESTVLYFCLREAVTPQDVATAIEQQLEGVPNDFAQLAESLRHHLPLSCLVEAQRILW